MHPLGKFVATAHTLAPAKISRHPSHPKYNPQLIEFNTAHLHPRLQPPSPTPPTTPEISWRWACCNRKCHATTPVGVSIRCLHCNHRSCLADSSSVTKRKPCGSSFEYGAWQERNEWRRDRTEYLDDPKGWDARTQGRFLRLSEIKSTRLRRAKRSQDEKERKSKRTLKRMQRLERGKNNCWTDCDYPGHCHFERYRAIVMAPLEDVPS
ncbi:Fc.00g009280.m01.CDS01 [Cosmosporella sp. VM-42]